MSFPAEGYKYAVEMAIDSAKFQDVCEFYRGMAMGLHLWADAVSKEQWDADSKRIAEARECARTTADEWKADRARIADARFAATTRTMTGWV